MTDDPMTPPDRPAPQPAPDLDAFELQVIKRSRIVATGYADAIEASNQAYVAARAAIVAEFTSLRERVSELEAIIAKGPDADKHVVARFNEAHARATAAEAALEKYKWRWSHVCDGCDAEIHKLEAALKGDKT